MSDALKAALVIGASGALGGAIARELSARNYSLALHYHSRHLPCDAHAAHVNASGRVAYCYSADFMDAAAPAALAAQVQKDFPRIDAIVWAAGIVRDAPVMTMKEEDLRAVLQVDVKALFLILKAFSRMFMKQKSGSIVALSSHAALSGRPGGAAYAMAHGGLLALIKSAAREFGPHGVSVNAVVPPFVPDSGMGRSASAEFAAGVKAKRVLKSEVGGAEALAKFVADVLGNAAISGQVLIADSRIAV